MWLEGRSPLQPVLLYGITMKKPPCPKCASANTYMEAPKFFVTNDEMSVACYTCGWRIYGEDAITELVASFNREESERERKRAELKIQLELLAAEALRKPHAIHSLGIVFRPGDMDLGLGLRWAVPSPNNAGEEYAPCRWPPCVGRSRRRSIYCSTKCRARVAHRRDKLRKEHRQAQEVVQREAS
jgi:hypothetical protein